MNLLEWDFDVLKNSSSEYEISDSENRDVHYSSPAISVHSLIIEPNENSSKTNLFLSNESACSVMENLDIANDTQKVSKIFSIHEVQSGLLNQIQLMHLQKLSVKNFHGDPEVLLKNYFNINENYLTKMITAWFAWKQNQEFRFKIPQGCLFLSYKKSTALVFRRIYEMSKTLIRCFLINFRIQLRQNIL